MSSIPNNGLVTIQFQIDRSNVDSYLAELRKGVTVPVRGDYIGPGGPAAQSASSIASANGPATFGNLGGAPVYGSGPGGTFGGGVGPGSGIVGSSFTMGGGYSGPANSAASLAQPVAQLSQGMQQLATTMTTLTNQFTQAMRLIGPGGAAQAGGGGAPQLANTGGGAGSPNYGVQALPQQVNPAPGNPGPTNPQSPRAPGGYGPFGLRRYGAPFMAGDIGLQALASGRQSNIDASLAAGDPHALAAANVSDFDRINNLSIFGLPIGRAFGLMTDPTGMGYAGVQHTLSESDLMDDIATGRRETGNRLMEMRGRAGIAGTRGFARMRAEVDEQHRTAYLGITDMRRGQNEKIFALGRQERQAIEDRYAEATKGPESWLSGLPWVNGNALPGAGAEANRQRDLGTQARTERDRIEASTRTYDAMGKAADEERKNRQAEIERQKSLAQKSLYYRRQSANLAARGQVGRAEEQAFNDRGELDILSADPEMQNDVRNTVGRERAAHNAEQRQSLQYQRDSLNALRLTLQHNTLGATIGEIRARADYEGPRAPNNNAEQAIRDRAGVQIDIARQQDYERYSRNLFSIESQTRMNNILAGRDPRYFGASPGERGIYARLDDIVSGNQGAIRDALNSNHPELVGPLGDLGHSQIAAMRSNYMASFHAVHRDVDLTPVDGPGVLDANRIAKAFTNADANIGKGGSTNDEKQTAKVVTDALNYIVEAVKKWERWVE